MSTLDGPGGGRGAGFEGDEEGCLLGATRTSGVITGEGVIFIVSVYDRNTSAVAKFGKDIR
jgi:hypothetical protein